MRILQVGAYPPPFGGVSVHLARLHERLQSAGLDSTILDVTQVPKQVPGVLATSWPEAVSELARTPRACVHFHNFDPGHAGAYERLARRHLTVLSLHNERFPADIARLGPLRRRVALARLRRLQAIVVDNRGCLEAARALWGPAADIRLIPEFIPPPVVPALAEPEISALRERCRFLLASTAWRAALDPNGEDAYGLDRIVEAVGRLVRERGLDVGLVLLVPGGEDPHLDTLRASMQRLGIAARSRILTRPIGEASSLWRIADLVVRATTTDGNSLTVLEALALGVPVLASDCVERPEGAVLFRTRDTADLTDRIAAVLADLDGSRLRLAGLRIADNAVSLIELYRELIARRAAHAV